MTQQNPPAGGQSSGQGQQQQQKGQWRVKRAGYYLGKNYTVGQMADISEEDANNANKAAESNQSSPQFEKAT